MLFAEAGWNYNNTISSLKKKAPWRCGTVFFIILQCLPNTLTTTTVYESQGSVQLQ